MSRLTDWLEPSSDEGDVFDGEASRAVELCIYGFFVLFGASFGISMLDEGHLAGVIILIAIPLWCLFLRRVVFGRYVVLGPEVIIMRGVVHTRRIELQRVRWAEASEDGTVHLVFFDGDALRVPGFTTGRRLWSGEYLGNPREGQWFAGEVNRRIALLPQISPLRGRQFPSSGSA